MSVEKPGDYYPRKATQPGAINFRLTASETENGRTIHLDAFHISQPPYGHISLDAARTMRNWMNETIKWLEDK